MGECRENQLHDTQYQAAIYLTIPRLKEQAIKSVDHFTCLGIDIPTNDNWVTTQTAS